MNQATIPIRFDKSHLTSIGSRLYAQSLDLTRELVANAYDADASKVDIKIDGNNLVVEDNGSGMNRLAIEQYFTIGSPYKKHHPLTPYFKRNRIGEFGIGKFAVLSLCDRFELYTQTKDYAATIIFDRLDFESNNEWTIPIIEHNKKGSIKTGTRVTLFALKRPLHMQDLERHLSQVFPLTDKNFSININGIGLQPHYIAGRRFKINESTKFGVIKGEIVLASLMIPREIMGIGIRVKGILIKRDTFQLEHRHSISFKRLTGEVNADFLPITTSRSEFIIDTSQYKIFYAIIQNKLKKVIRQIEKSSLSYADKKAEKTLVNVLGLIRQALRKNNDIFFDNNLPLFTTKREKKNEQISDNIIGKSLANKTNHKLKKGITGEMKSALETAIKKLKPKIRRPVRTILRDDKRIIKKVKIGGVEFLVSFAHLGTEEKESFTEGGIIFINRDHELFKKTEKKIELTSYHLIRLVTQELIKLTSTNNLDVAYDWQGRLINDAFVKIKNETDNG